MSLSSERQHLSVNQISSTYLNPLPRYKYFLFKKTTVRHIGVLFPVSILTIAPYMACHSALRCRISSKSVHLQRRYDFIVFQDGGSCGAILLPVSDFGDVAVFRMSVSISKPNFVVKAQSTAET